MIIRINGKIVSEASESFVLESGIPIVRGRGLKRNLGKSERPGIVFKMPTSQKIIFTVAIGTLVADMLLGGGGTAVAAVATTATKTISVRAAFEPVKHLILDIADPLCYVMFAWGCIEAICMRPASGLNRMKYAAIGYIAINWVPVVMQVIRNAGP
ncbi:hypothetical protein ACTFSJ_27705 [Bacillus cereus group sp. MYBK12-2]|uniref:hypothetical protein n=1 Tax=Bacillus cereus group sp. MYBK12-2 TaxID=3450689 RepID=UPI0032FA8628|nr:hypothetical protein [Bacillus pacificus]HDR7653594.1 hypothetical protein [Bacillus pacificus]